MVNFIQASVFLLEIQHVFLNIYICASKVAFLKSGYICGLFGGGLANKIAKFTVHHYQAIYTANKGFRIAVPKSANLNNSTNTVY